LGIYIDLVSSVGKNKQKEEVESKINKKLLQAKQIYLVQGITNQEYLAKSL
jgi:hypothetical protein